MLLKLPIFLIVFPTGVRLVPTSLINRQIPILTQKTVRPKFRTRLLSDVPNIAHFDVASPGEREIFLRKMFCGRLSLEACLPTCLEPLDNAHRPWVSIWFIQSMYDLTASKLELDILEQEANFALSFASRGFIVEFLFFFGEDLRSDLCSGVLVRIPLFLP